LIAALIILFLSFQGFSPVSCYYCCCHQLIVVTFSSVTSLLKVAVTTRYAVAAAAATTDQDVVSISLSVTAVGKVAVPPCCCQSGCTATLLPSLLHCNAVGKAAAPSRCCQIDSFYLLVYGKILCKPQNMKNLCRCYHSK